ncbi:hypothetical protein FA95DRAFT_1583972 [Auriscalpium vulgare]|uniref:Uncharacterized protein n=1 Tax=Auriscalpium vulgare TaxID=40419 RepID=A0ACB8RI59_9AGAM|nr:hypothetical protein FA95DRAFT_1583972 [Auriscalpium vulgare]
MRPKVRPPTTPPTPTLTACAYTEDEEPPSQRRSPLAAGDESSDDSADEYQQSRAAPKKRKRVRMRDEDVAADEDGGRRRRRSTGQRKTTSRKKKAAPTAQDLADLPEGQARKLKLDMEIDSILKSKKASRPKKRKKDEDVLDQVADMQVSTMREMMLAAADDDDKANREKMPATAKLRLLPQVMDVLRKGALWQSIVDNNLMEGVRRWLEPLPDRSLPALNIQRDFFDILPSLDIDTAVLKESKLGRVILFYTKCKRVVADIQRTASNLVSTWSRPIIKRSASYRDRAIPTADAGADEPRGERLNVILARAKEGERNRTRKNAVMIPQRELGTYTVAPRSNAGVLKSSVSVDMDTERRKRNADRLRSLTRKIQSQARGQSIPRTPPLASPAQPPIYLPTSNNRLSSDSWNSSSAADEMEWEWKPDQVLLLKRTLDALPQHLLTPFNGPVPPSNLLDKIARGVASAKGAADWPHSMRATRAKLVELARARDAIVEEDAPREVLHHTTNIKRPLYRQSSMDFMQSATLEPRDDPFSSSSIYHPYARPSSPAHFYAQSLNPSTPSSTTLHSTRSHMRDEPKVNSTRSSLRHSTSTLSSTSSSMSLPRVQPRRNDSLPNPAQYLASPIAPKNLKRATSFRAAAPAYASSDEEEQQRTKHAKKARRGTAGTGTASPSPSPVRPRMNIQRNPSILGAELPHPQVQPNPPAHLRVQIPALNQSHCEPPRTPRSPRLRRVRPAVFPGRSARRISFNSLGESDVLLEPVDIVPGEGLGQGLDSAFQLR